MMHEVEYSGRERAWLLALAVVGFAGVNGAFIYGLVFDPDALSAAMTNPVSAAFVAEALILVGVWAYLLRKWQVTRIAWGWFVVLSLAGSMAFALPVALLWKRRTARPQSSSSRRTG